MDTSFELRPYWPSAAERRRQARKRRCFLRRRALLRWVMRIFRLYRRTTL